MDKNLRKKLFRLQTLLSGMKSVLVAYSGGVDSSLLLKVAKDVLANKVLAVTAKSPLYPEDEINEAKRIAQKIGTKHLIINTNELKDSDFVKNPINRCYICKKKLFSALKKIAQKHNLNFIIDGSNIDDNRDYRPGSLALREFKISSPLKEAKLNKKDIRALSRSFRLPTWDKPAIACMASRIPYNEKIDRDNLSKIENGEKIIKKLGVTQVRLRHHKNLARIEIPANQFLKVIRYRKNLIKKIKKLGYNYVCIDLQGYRTGSLNEVLH